MMSCCVTKSALVLAALFFILWRIFFKKTKYQKLNQFFVEKIIQTSKTKKNEIEKECLGICSALVNEPVVTDEAEVAL
jgi:hypothetical protein